MQISRKAKVRQSLKTLSYILTLSVVVISMGFGCGEDWRPEGLELLPADHFNLSPSPQDAGDNDDLVIIPGEKTVSVAYFDLVYQNYLEATGFEEGEIAYFDLAYNNSKELLSEDGSILSGNAAMFVGITTITGKLCFAVVDRDLKLPAGQQKLFGGFYGKRNLSEISDEAIQDSLRRLARTFWQRNETQQELEIFLNKMDELRALNSNLSASNSAFFMCTAVASSLSAIDM